MNRAISPPHHAHAVAAPNPRGGSDAELRSRILHRQFAAVMWIALAWVAGTVVFEFTAMGDGSRHIKFESQEDTFLGFFGNQLIRGAAKTSDTESSSL